MATISEDEDWWRWLIGIDTFNAEYTVEIKTCGGERAGDHIVYWEMPYWVPAFAMLLSWESRYCCEVWNFKL